MNLKKLHQAERRAVKEASKEPEQIPRKMVDIDTIAEEGVLGGMLMKRSQLIQEMFTTLRSKDERVKTLEAELAKATKQRDNLKEEIQKLIQTKKGWGKRITELEAALRVAGLNPDALNVGEKTKEETEGPVLARDIKTDEKELSEEPY